MAIVRDARQALPAARFDLEVRKRYAEQIGTLDAKRLALKQMDICDWAESNFYLNSTSKPIQLTLWQKGIVRMATSRGADGRFHYTTVLYGTVKKSGKALDIATPICTPSGWTTMGELRAGDEVFAGNGSVCHVVDAFPVLHDRPCYAVRFSDGAEIVADAEHQWSVRTLDRGAGMSRGGYWVATTAQLSEHLRAGAARNHSVDVAGALTLPDRMLPVPPYVLGAWLGDGHSAVGRITSADSQIIDEIRAEGVSIRHEGSLLYALPGLYAPLRGIGVLGNKHVPPMYLRSSAHQRMALLQGLMDTDGTVDRVGRGHCELTLTCKPLVDSAAELIRSLGFKPTVRESRARLNGRDVGPRWRIAFTAYAERPVFRLQRKIDRLPHRSWRIMKRLRSDSRQIVAIESVPVRPVRCIRVDAPSGVFLAGHELIPTHNSTIGGLVARWTAETQTRFGEVICLGNDSDQARDRAMKEAKFSIQMTPGYLYGRDVLPGRWKCLENSLRCMFSGSMIKAVAVDAKGEAGGHPALTVWCVAGDTEVLCRAGWKRASELTVDDEVAALVPSTGKMRWECPRAVNVTPYKGTMVKFTHRRAEFTVTPNHRVWGRFVTHSRAVNKAKDRGWWFEEAKAAAKFAGGWLKGDAGWDPENYYDTETARLLGYYIAEGHVSRNRVVISQSREKNPETYEAIRQAFVDVGLEPRCTALNIAVNDVDLAAQLRPLGKSWDKFIPPHLKNGPVAALRAFFDAYIAGDGWRTPSANGWQCETTSKRLADDLMEIALKLGYHPRLMGSRLRKPGLQPNGSGKPLTPRHMIHRLSFSTGPIYWERTYNGKKAGKWEEIEYDGVVACPSLEHGVFYIRTNGKCLWTGNTELWGFESQDALRFWDEMTQDPTQPDSVRWVETYAGYDGESTLLYGLYSTATEKGHQLTNAEFASRVCRDVDGERYEDFLHCWDNERWGDDIHGNPDAPVPIYTLDEAGLFAYWDEGVTARRFEWQDERYYREQEASLPGASFLRFHENLWVGGESDYIPMALWDQCDDPELHDDGKYALLPDVYDGNGHRVRGEPGVMSCDAGVSNDCFAIVFTTRHPLDKKMPAIRKVKVFKPKDFGPGTNYSGSPADRIDFNVVEQWIRDICKSYNVVQICYDPWQLEDMMQRLSRERVSWTEPFSQGKERHEADRGLHDRVMQGKLAHAGDLDLRHHIQNAKAKIQKDEESKMKIIKKSDLRKIDAAVCASMGVARVMWLNLG